MEHYFTANSQTEMTLKAFEATIGGITLKLSTSNAVFSKQQVDYGSQVLLETLMEKVPGMTGRLLDVGCGYGTLGLFLAKANPELQCDLVDINERAVALANKNAVDNGLSDRVRAWASDQLTAVTETYQVVITNPPIRAGKSVVHGIYEGAYRVLAPGGRLYVVIQKKQGAPSSKEALERLFGSCEVVNRQSGYHILCAVKGA